MAETLSIDFNQVVPVFPLPTCVLLPHVTVPLHIFEPRYRKMIADALDSRGLIAMAMFEGEAWKKEYEGRPPIRPCVCVGYIVRHEAMPDGRYNLLVQGVCRARVRKEIAHEPYRVALLQPTETGQMMEIDLGDDRRQLEDLLNDPVLKKLASVNAIHNWLSTEIPTPVLIDLAIMTVCDNLEHRYSMLAENNTPARSRWLTRHLGDLRRTLVMADRIGDSLSQDGQSLN